MSASKIYYMLCENYSSGTSAGERKLMPTIHQEMDRRQLLYSLLMPVMNQYVSVPSLIA